MKLFDGNGKTVDISVENSKLNGVANGAKTFTPYGNRSNIVLNLAYSNAGTVRWMEGGLRFKRTSPGITEFTFIYSIAVSGAATKVQLKCTGNGDLTVYHDYTGGEMTFTDTFSDTTKLNSDYINLYALVSTVNVEDVTYIGTGLTLKLAEIPAGLELVGEYISRTPTLTTNSLTFDESTKYQRYVSRWQGRRWMAMGDSITQGVLPYYHQVAGEMLQMETVTNGGMGGSSLVQWANGKLFEKYYQGYDLVTIMHGINDHDNSPNSPLGTLLPHGSEFDKSTYIGAYQFIVETIQANSPNTEIALLKSQYVSNDNWANSEGLTMTDYRNAVDIVAESYGLPVFDTSTVITSSNYGEYLSDGIHPTAEGQALLGDAIGKWLATI